MPSIFNLFPEHWSRNTENTFPIEIDIKYALLRIQSQLESKFDIHPVLYPLYDTISKHEKSIVRDILLETELPEEEDRLMALVLTHCFHYSVANTLRYAKFIKRHYSLQLLREEFKGVYASDWIFYVWQDEFRIWIPAHNHRYVQEYLEKFESTFGSTN